MPGHAPGIGDAMADANTETTTDIAPRELLLRGLHEELGAKFVPFARWDMPVQYPMGVMGEHQWCREKAGLFDVSHMGQVRLAPDADAALEALVPVDVIGLAEGRQRYGFFTAPNGGVLDDLMIARQADALLLVLNASRASEDIAHMRAHGMAVDMVEDRALLALQGPLAADVLLRVVPETGDMRFMDSHVIDWQGVELWVSRSGYTGEDGFEISVPASAADTFARRLLEDDAVAPIGLGARDSLRLEAGLPLYGQDMTPDISPVEAGQGWAVSKLRRTGGARAGGFPGAGRILRELAEGPARRRVGLLPDGRAPMRAGTPIFADESAQTPVGHVTSGGFGPSLGAPMAMALIAAETPADMALFGQVRTRRLPARQSKLPFVRPGYKR